MTPADRNTRERSDGSGLRLKCRVCGHVGTVGEFVRDRSRISSGGFKSRCRECDRALSKAYYQRVRERKARQHLERRLASHGPRMCEWPDGCDQKATTQRSHYCSKHRQVAIDNRLQRRGKMSMWGLMVAREKDARRTAQRKALGQTTVSRGYGRVFVKTKEEWQRRFDAGEFTHCRDVHCLLPGVLIGAGIPWDLGHAPDGSIRGPEHRRCNRATARLARRRERELAA